MTRQPIFVCLLIFFSTQIPLPAPVFTTRSRSSIRLDVPSSYHARAVYSGRFLINGQPADMRVIAGDLPVGETVQLLKGALGGKGLKCEISGQTATGRLTEGQDEKRFLIASLGGLDNCLLFLLEGKSGAFVRSRPDIPWPAVLPVLDPQQVPKLVVEHLDNRFIFASVLVPGNRTAAILESCQQQLQAAGWEAVLMKNSLPGDLFGSGSSVMGGRQRICWMDAHPVAGGNQTQVTIVCRTE
ncbi:MAG: hypothetical protein PHV34_17785 [Verrucomicrobiae bacterium]|nr:hypothetical protein [Verrucomicrobiae bacterium]